MHDAVVRQMLVFTTITRRYAGDPLRSRHLTNRRGRPFSSALEILLEHSLHLSRNNSPGKKNELRRRAELILINYYICINYPPPPAHSNITLSRRADKIIW